MRGTGIAALACWIVVLPAAAEDLERVLARYVEARGGEAAIGKIETIRADGKMIMGGGMEAQFHYEWKRPEKIRFELTQQGVTEVQASDGRTHWTIDPPSQPEPGPMSPSDFAMLNDGVDFIGPLFRFAQKGHSVKLVGPEEIEGTPSWKLEVVKRDGLVEHSYLDAEYFLEILQVEKHRLPNGEELELEVTWGDYKEIDGVLLPHSWSRKMRGAPAGLTLAFERMEVNVEIPDSRFEMPAAGSE